MLKVYVDRDDRLAKDWQATMRDRDFVGQTEIQSRMGEGYGAMTAISARKLRQ